MTTTFTSVLRQHTVEVGVIAERLAKLSAAIRVYRTAGRDEVADVLLDEFTALLDDMDEEERTDLTLILIARAAPPMELCRRCDHVHQPGAACPGPACPTCLRPVAGPLADCDQPECIRIECAREARLKRLEDW